MTVAHDNFLGKEGRKETRKKGMTRTEGYQGRREGRRE
jgi:hypothetical protein